MRKLPIVITVLLILFGLFCQESKTAAVRMPGSLDAELFLAVIARMKSGEPYYQALGAEQVARNYPTKPVFAWRLPTLLVIEAALPSLGWSVALLSVIGLLAAASWWRYFRIRGAEAVLTCAFTLGPTLPLWAWLAPRDVTLHDLWAGQLISLSLACWALGRRRAGLAAAAFALTIRELALPYVFAMSVMAWLEKRRHEAAWWGVLIVAFAIGLAWHSVRVAANMPPGGYANSWIEVGGWCFALATVRANVLLLLAPAWALAVVTPLFLLALSRWTSPVGRRVAMAVMCYLTIFMIVGRPFNWYWGLLIAPVLPLGVVFHVSRRQNLRPNAELTVL